MTARILGWQLGLARALGAIIFSVVIGLAMHFIFIKEERARKTEGELFAGVLKEPRTLWQNALYFFAMVGFLIFANWARPETGDTGLWALSLPNMLVIRGILGTKKTIVYVTWL